MATTLTGTIELNALASLLGTGSANPTANLQSLSSVVLAASEVTFLYLDEVTSVLANKTYDLIGASALLDPFGVAVDIDKIAALIVINTHATQYLRLSVLPATIIAGGSSPILIIPPSGFFAWAAPVGVATTTNFVVTGRDTTDAGNADSTWTVIALGKHA
jgi:hypothetical protein